MANEQTREPLRFAAGDTLAFIRSLPHFPATDGWSIKYEIRGGVQPIEFTSVADGSDHAVTVEEDVTAEWLPGAYVLAGYVIQASTNDRHQIYYGSLEILKDMVSAPGDTPVQTHAQVMIPLIEAQLARMASHDLNDSKVETSEFNRVRRTELMEELNYYKSVRANEIAVENAKNGRPTGNKITPIFRVTM